MYENGKGVSQDENEAIKWYKVASEQGNTLAKEKLDLLPKKGGWKRFKDFFN